FAPRGLRINPCNPHGRTCSHRKRHGQKDEAGSLIGKVMSPEMSLVLRIFVKRVNLQGVALDNGAQQIEAGVLVPSSALEEINEGEKARRAQQTGSFPVRRRTWGKPAHAIRPLAPAKYSRQSRANRCAALGSTPDLMLSRRQQRFRDNLFRFLQGGRRVLRPVRGSDLSF